MISIGNLCNVAACKRYFCTLVQVLQSLVFFAQVFRRMMGEQFVFKIARNLIPCLPRPLDSATYAPNGVSWPFGGFARSMYISSIVCACAYNRWMHTLSIANWRRVIRTDLPSRFMVNLSSIGNKGITPFDRPVNVGKVKWSGLKRITDGG